MAAGGGGGRGGLGWLILAAALAVPGFLFYNWWSHLKAEHDHSISAKASKLAAGGVFQTPSPQTGRLINPMASTAAPAGLPPGAPPSKAAASAAAPAASGGALPAKALPPGTASAATMPTTAAAMPAAVPAATTTPGSALAGAATPAADAGAAASSSTIVLTRDPMMSPLDAVRLQEAAMAEADRLAAIARANQPAPTRGGPRPPRKQVPIERHIELQGIVAKADGDNLAIINGATVNPGESFTVEHYPGKVRIVKITSTEVTLDYKGRKIKLSVNAD